MTIRDMTGARLLLLWLLSLLLWLASPAISMAQAPKLLGEVTFGQDGDKLVAAFKLHIPDGYHAYAHDAGDEGLPTRFECSPQALSYYPKGTVPQKRDEAVAAPPIYEGEVFLFAAFDKAQAGENYVANIEMLLCSAQQCLPASLAFKGNLPAYAPDVIEMPWVAQWRGHVAPSPKIFTPRYDVAWLETGSMWQAIFWGFLAGMLLNIMPCVLPVLSLKVSALLTNNGASRAMRSYCLYFAAGILSFFTILALVLGLGGMLWGQLFQSETLVTCLLFTVVLLALSLFGLYTLPVLDLKVTAHSQHGGLHAYLTGMLATLLATPCSGPFLGGVLAWVVNQPLAVALVVFWCVGLGMGMPYVILAVHPRAARILPRPGPWLEVVEKALAFFLLGTGLYLLSILPNDQHIRLLATLLGASVACWWYGRFCGLNAPKWRRRLGFALCASAVLACLVIGLRPTSKPDLWEDYDPATFSSLVGKEPLFLEFTADWCPNCKFLEATVLTPENMEYWRARYALRFVRVDLTAKDAAGLPLLRSLGSQSIPLAAIFHTGEEGATQPTVLRDVYGKERLERALEQTLGKKTD